MAIYRFSFDDKYAGRQAIITDAINGALPAGSPVTLDASGDGALNIPTGAYRAQVSNSEGGGDGYSVVDGILDVNASLDAAGGSNSIKYVDLNLNLHTPPGWVGGRVPLVAVPDYGGWRVQETLQSGPVIVPAGGTIGSISIYGPAAPVSTFEDIEILITDIDGVNSWYSYFSESIPTDVNEFTVVPETGGLDQNATVVGTDLTHESDGNFKTAAGGTFWVTVIFQVAPI